MGKCICVLLEAVVFDYACHSTHIGRFKVCALGLDNRAVNVPRTRLRPAL